jgi:hypothetical protein
MAHEKKLKGPLEKKYEKRYKPDDGCVSAPKAR